MKTSKDIITSPVNLNFTSRVITPELIDNFEMSGKALEKAFTELKWINKTLGTAKSVVNSVLNLVSGQDRCLTIVDIGCGMGDILRSIECRNPLTGFTKLIGLDANQAVVDLARTEAGRNISIQCLDVLENKHLIPNADIYIMSQFLHHFEMHDIQKLLHTLAQKQPEYIIIHDLKRSEMAFHLFGTLCKWKGLSFITTYDGQLSISKGFIKKDMSIIIEMLNDKYTCKFKKSGLFYWQLICKKK